MFILLASVINTYIILCQFIFPHRKIPGQGLKEWTSEEVDIISKYYLFFRYPYACRSLGANASGVYLFGFVLGILLIFHHEWMYSTMVIINATVSMFLQSKLNPVFFLHDAVEKRKKEVYREEMMLVDSICKKMFLS